MKIILVTIGIIIVLFIIDIGLSLVFCFDSGQGFCKTLRSPILILEKISKPFIPMHGEKATSPMYIKNY